MLLWLADVLRDAGLHVVEYDGWRTRTRAGGIAPRGIVAHHTATPRSASDKAVRKLLAEGRPDLPGPLSQLGLERDGTFVVIAAGRCNHNGYGLWGNDSIGIEAYNDGIGEPWAPAQVDAYQRGCAAICAHLGWDASRIKAHRETDPGRKIDPKGIDMPAFRAAVTDLLATPPEEDDMKPEIIKVKGGPEDEMWITGDYVIKRRITKGHAGTLVFLGHACWNAQTNAPFEWPADVIDRITSIDDGIWTIAMAVGAVQKRLG